MGELRFVGPPRRKGPVVSVQVLLTVGALVIAAAAFLLGRLSVNPPPPAAPASLPAPAPAVAPPAEPARIATRPPAVVAQVLSPSPFAPAGPASNSASRSRARNSFGVAFSNADVAFEVRALSLGGGGLAGRGRRTFQSTIPPQGTAETLHHIRCDGDRSYRFEAAVAPVR